MKVSEKLRAIFKHEDPYAQAAFQDLFAIGCYLHATGQQDAGLKTCATALRGAHSGQQAERSILKHLPGNERECFEAAWPHSELKMLLKVMS
jgi:hypothetical protein